MVGKVNQKWSLRSQIECLEAQISSSFFLLSLAAPFLWEWWGLAISVFDLSFWCVIGTVWANFLVSGCFPAHIIRADDLFNFCVYINLSASDLSDTVALDAPYIRTYVHT